jgi:hypothetical protein
MAPETQEQVQSFVDDELALESLVVPDAEISETPHDEVETEELTNEVEDFQAGQADKPKNVRYEIVKAPHSVPDPLVRNRMFILDGWAYRVYDERSRGRKFLQRLGVVRIIEAQNG